MAGGLEPAARWRGPPGPSDRGSSGTCHDKKRSESHDKLNARNPRCVGQETLGISRNARNPRCVGVAGHHSMIIDTVKRRPDTSAKGVPRSQAKLLRQPIVRTTFWIAAPRVIIRALFVFGEPKPLKSKRLSRAFSYSPRSFAFSYSPRSFAAF